MSKAYYKSERTQYPEFFGPRYGLSLRPTFCQSTPRSVAASSKDAEFCREGLCVAVCQNEAAITLGGARASLFGRYSAVYRDSTRWPRSLRRRQCGQHWEVPRDAYDWRSSSACKVGAPRAVGAEINPSPSPRVIFARGGTEGWGRGAERRVLFINDGITDECFA
jgi:hypothetical protein